MKNFQPLINGELTGRSSSKFAESVNPGSGKPSGLFIEGNLHDAELAVKSARYAFDHGEWPHLDPAERARILHGLADLIQAEIYSLAYLEAADSGGLISRTRFDVMQGIRFLRRMATCCATEFEWQRTLPKGSNLNPSVNLIVREPVGVCAAIIPWNFPLLMALWKLTMALCTGNTLILKPSPETPLSALGMGEIIARSEIPPGVVNILTGPGKEIGEFLVNHPQVDKIAFTGSLETGKQIMKQASTGMKRLTLELGGKSPCIILDDANPDLVIDGALYAAFLHSGQVCEAGSRLLIPENQSERLISELVKRTKKIRTGYQFNPLTQMGPLIHQNHLERVAGFVQRGIKAGARLLTGGNPVCVNGFEKGFYYEPTIFAGVTPDMELFREEIFGPVLSVTTYRTEEELIELANDSMYGLAAGIWSSNYGRARKLAKRIRAGTVWINDWHVFHDFGPFGGFKNSGFGRELGREGLESFTEIKHVHIGTEGNPDAKPGHKILTDRKKSGSYENLIPTRIISGTASLSRIKGEIHPAARIMIITDQGVIRAGIIERILKIIGDNIIYVYSEVPQDSGIRAAKEALKLARDNQADTIISVGGGSVIDTGKVTAAALGNGISAEETIGFNHLGHKPAKHIVIPTTAGTGSEVTNVAVVYNELTRIKMYVLDDNIFPDTAILDPELTLSLPTDVTAISGLDALTHAVEAMMSTRSNPFTDALAIQAIRLIAGNLTEVLNNGYDIEARGAMLNAANLAGMAIAQARVGLVHAMSHALGAHHRIPHGLANAILLPYVLAWNSETETAKSPLQQVFTAFVLSNNDSTADHTLGVFTNKIGEWLRTADLPTGLQQAGLAGTDFRSLAEIAFADPAILTNIRPVTSIDEIIKIYQSAC